MKKGFIFSILTLVFCLFVGTATAQTYPVTESKTTTVTSTRTTTWNVPAGTWKITKVECWGAGGGGGNTSGRMGAGGGGGGAYAAYSSEIATTPGASFNIKVGAGGTGGNAGGNSYFSTSDEANAYAVAGGGKSPGASTSTCSGGAVIRGTGYNGGNGGQGRSSSTYASGGGGGAAGPSQNGGNGGSATSSAAGSAGNGRTGISSNMGNGGAGKRNTGAAGNAGTNYGGGGGGACKTSNGGNNYTGGTGAQGAIRITYETRTLQVTRNLNYGGAPSGGTFTIDFYGKYTAANLPTPTRDGYIFLGWTTDPAGQNYLTTDSVCKKTNNYTIYAHWGVPGTITTSTRNLSSVCGKDTVKSLADPSGASYFRYTWHYTFNGGGLQTINNSDVKEYAVSSSILTQAGTYVFTRSVAFRNSPTAQWSSEVTSEGAYTIVYRVESNAITAKDTTARSLNNGFSIHGSEVVGATYRWKNDGVVLEEAIDRNLTVDNNSLFCPNKQSQYQREVMVAPCGWQTSDNVYKISIALDTIESKTVSYTHNHPQITIHGELVPNVDYSWNCQNFPVPEASDQDLTIPANSLCPDSAYEFTRNVESMQCVYDVGSSRSAGKYTVTISTDAGSIVGGDSTAAHNYGAITIEGTQIDNVDYQWFCNDTLISGAEYENYTIPAGLCPDSTYVFTRKVKASTHVDAKWKVSANTYTLRVRLEPGSIDSKEDTTITTKESLTINGEDMGANVTYEWLQNGASISVTTQSYTLDAANMCPGSYTYTRKVISSSCEKYKMSENEYKVTVTFPTGAIDSSAIDICGISIPDDKSVASIEPAVAQLFKYIWMYSKNGAAFVKSEYTSEGLSKEQLSGICSDVQDDDTYIIRRYAKLTNGCEMDSVASKGSVKIYFMDMENDTLDAPAINVTCNYGENFIYREILPVPALMHKGVARTDWIDTVLSPAAKIYPDPATMKANVHWIIKDKCGNLHEKDQEVTCELPNCGEGHTIVDIDGNEYQTVRVGFNCWMKENLKTTRYADGSAVPNIRAYKGERQYVDSAQNAQTFGLLYTWDAAVHNTIASSSDVMIQGICPDGWYLPNAAQFEKMIPIDAKSLRTQDYWLTLDGTNTTDFSMLPGGCYNSAHNRYENLLGNAYFWTSDSYSETEARTFEADCHCYKWQEIHTSKANAFSVRCIQAEEVQPVSMNVRTDTAMSVDETGATLYGTVLDMSGVSAVNVGFKYGVSDAEMNSIIVKNEAMTATGAFTCDLSGLSVGVKYSYKAFEAHGLDTVYGEIKHFTTATMVVTTDSVNTITMRSAILYGNVKDLAGLASVDAGFKYGTSEEALETLVNAAAPVTAVGSYNCTLNDLTANTTYYYKAFEANGTDTVYGEVKSFTTPVMAVTTDSASSIMMRGAKLYGNVKDLAGLSSVDAGFKYGTSEDALETLVNAAAPVAATGSYNCTLNDLTANTTYYYKAFEANGTDTVYGEVKSFKTLVMAVTTDSASSIMMRGAKLYGNVKDLAGLSSVDAGFKYGTSEDALETLVNAAAPVAATGSYNCTLNGLAENTQYYFKAFAANGTDTVYGNVISFTTMFACGTEKVVDIDNNQYNTVLLGNQCWMAENLRTKKFSDGTPIEFHYYNNDYDDPGRYTPNAQNNESATIVQTYGYLYNWYAVMNGATATNNIPSGVQGVCPTGWHVPSLAEWNVMVDFVKSQTDYYCNANVNNIAKALASTSGWNNANGTCNVGYQQATNNASRFNAYPAGKITRGSTSGGRTRAEVEGYNSKAYFWSTTTGNQSVPYLQNNSATLNYGNHIDYEVYSVRCVLDPVENE